MELHLVHIFDIKDVHYAVLETDGSISVLPTAAQKGVTVEDLKIKGEEESIDVELIIDGKVIQSAVDISDDIK
ncbi:MAG: YetF domain-containing protein [Bacillota bacterium]